MIECRLNLTNNLNSALMEIALLILAALIFGKTTKQAEKSEIKIIAGTILGISYFVIWPYLYYYVELHAWTEMLIQISFITLVAVSLLFVRVLIEIKFYEVVQIFSICLFIIFWILSSIYDIKIRDQIADYTGYFSDSLISHTHKTELLTKQINSPTNAYSAFIPEYWKEYTHTGTLLPFYKPADVTRSIIEFRPRCDNKQNYSISKIVKGMSSIHQENQTSSYQCFHWNKHNYACRITISDNTGITRVRWIGANKETSHLLELDFVMKKGNQQDLMIVDAIFKSVKFNESADKTANCVTPIEWF